MSFLNWIRKIRLPHPTYGNCCGQNLDCSGGGTPEDKLCEGCLEHDMNLYAADQIEDKHERKLIRKEADLLFAQHLRNDLGPFKQKVWGPIYQSFAKIIFRV